MSDFFTKKSLGQNFLRSPKALKDIVDAADLQPKDLVLEIGPGEGTLTAALLEKDSTVRVIAIEKDDRLIPILNEKFEVEIKEGRLTLVHGDILELPLHSKVLSDLGLKDKKFKVVANIPYYITGAILPMLLSEKIQPSKAVVLVQKEVAERVVARDGKESILSVSVKAYGKTSIAARVPRGAFVPAPNVDSAVLVIDGISKNFFKKISENDFFKVVKTGFAHKRKLLGTNLDSMGYKTARQALTEMGKDPLRVRSEELTLDDWKMLTEKVS